MKKLYTLLVVAAFAVTILAQAPQKMSYQAVVRNNTGELVTNQAVGMKISIQQGSATGTVVFSETYSPNPQTNANGLVTVEIGSGTATVGSFSAINWSGGTYYLRTETDPAGGTNYTISGTSQLLSVPYAMHAKTVESLAAETDPVFNASPAKGITSGNVTNWNTAYGWGNHSGLYRPVSWVPSWADVTGKPSFASVATSGIYNDLLNRPVLFDGTWASLTGKPSFATVATSGMFADLLSKPTTLAGYGITDADNSNTNEIQTLSLSGTQLSLSLGGGTVTLPSSGGGDNWGTQVVVTDATLAGNGTTATPLRIADNGVTSAKIADGAVATVDLANNSVTSAKIVDGTITTSDLADNSVTTLKIVDGTIVRADLAENSVTSEKIVDGTIATADLADNVITNAKIINTAVTTDKLANSAVTAPKLASMGATAGDVLKFNGSAWMPGIDEGLTIPYSNYASTSTPLFTIENYDTGHGSAIYALSKGAYGIHGISYSTSGVGVRGLAEADNGTTYGVYGRSESPDGYGVVGYGAAADGHAIGVRGESSSTKGRGVFGMASSAIGWTHGVRGRSESPNGYGVSGFAAAGIGNTYGIHGESASNQGRGVFGYTSAGSGITYAVAGRANSTEGRGVFGDAAATSGTNYGVYGKTASPDGYAGYFDGPMHVSGNVGIGTINPAYKLDIAGGMNLNKGITSGVAIRCNGAEALTYNGTYFSFGFGNPGNYSVFGRKVCIGTTSDPGEHHLVVNGTAAKPGGGSWATWSDERLKDIHGVYSKGLSEIVELQPVSFSYRETNSLNLPADKEYVGLIAQDVREILPEAVTEGQDGYLHLDIHPVNAALINAVKELKAENDKLKSENEQINSRLARLEKIIEQDQVK